MARSPRGGFTLNATASALQLVDFRRRVAAAYEVARGAGPGEARWRRFRALRDELFAHHPCSPLDVDDRASMTGVPYYPFEPAARVLADAQDAPGEPFEIALHEDGLLRLERLAYLSFDLAGRRLRLALYRFLGYGGGLFLPFRDDSAGGRTYGGGRYLIDTRKHADLGTVDELQAVERAVVLVKLERAHDVRVHEPYRELPLAPQRVGADAIVHEDLECDGSPGDPVRREPGLGRAASA